jgi:hypothetical protein
MKTKMSISNFFATAVIAMLTIAITYAQNNLGEACGCPPVASRPTVDFTTLDSAGTGSLLAKHTILTCDKTWILSKKFYVGNGKDITIQPGTVVKGEPESVPGTSRDGGVLVISRGAKIFAAGTESCPIVFTTTLDPMDGTYGITNKGKWGGVVICGTATNNLVAPANEYTGTNGFLCTATSGVGFVEGFTNVESRIYFGAGDPGFPTFDDNDNSGILTYVSVRHGGEVIGANNEINGLTLCSVGRGTTIHHIEVVSNLDDGIEFFGGTVDVKYASVLFNDDDGFDWDLNWSGRGQFWVVVKTDQGTASGGDNGFESDGDDNKTNATPSNPNVYNATYIGSNNINGNGTQKGKAIECKENTTGTIRNSVFANYKIGANFVNDASRPGGLDAYDNWIAGTLKVECNTYTGNTTLLQVNNAAPSVGDSTKFANDGNIVLGSIPGFDYIHGMNVSTNAVTDVMDVIPSPNLSVSGCPVAPVDGFFTPALYRGAFEAGKKSWLSNYSLNALIDLENDLVPCPTDVNKDGTTNNSDFLDLLGAFNQSCD